MNIKKFSLTNIISILKNNILGNDRSSKAKKNILASLLIKGLSIVISFLMVRVTLDYLDQTKYGIWLTISSLLAWFSFFDIGLGNGLRNKLTETIAKKDFALGKTYVSTTYAILAIIISIIAILFFIANHFINWTHLLNTENAYLQEISILVVFVFGFFFMQFVLQIINVVLNADQRPAIASSFGTISNLIALIAIIILTKTTQASLLYIGLALSLAPIIVLLSASFYFYHRDYKLIAPSIKYINFSFAKDLADLGVKFFIIQIAALVVYQSSNIIISNFFGPDQVTIYNIAYKYYSLPYMIFAIIMTPFWSAFTDAWVKQDLTWIKTIVQKLVNICWVFGLSGLFLLIVSKWGFKFWIGDKIQIPFYLSIGLLFYFLTFMFATIFTMFINGVGKIRLQMYGAILITCVFIGLTLILVKVFNMGIISIVIGSIISNAFSLIVYRIQYLRIMNNTATGIWNQ